MTLGTEADLVGEAGDNVFEQLTPGWTMQI